MKIALICTGGLSTNWILNKLRDYAQSQNQTIDFKAYGLTDYFPNVQDADAVLLGPQIGYYQKEIEGRLGRKIGVISSNDYATANAEHILNQAFTLAGK